ncbi:DUF6136 family protein [Rheinheimera nanhaiensis]|uniref:Uncharacterized protein n=1 Tax=Rheinheimera nanhaiensis E407-8 TaxID=562729 RepID=I1E056_9GAMM|nr:DUF6136 family protein [Rheinheimera nanhaiensis]GAB59684.1 hypothetical protein RNAN_2690 [Rheinheimera nanhaiensis E407-8]
MRFSAYLKLRWRCFYAASQQLIQQLQQLVLWILVLLGPALAALGFMLLLALGLLYQPGLAATERLLLCWCLLSGQTLLLWLYQQAILASRYRLFLRSFAITPLWQRSVDILLMFVCSPILVLHLLIIAGADLSQWHTVLPQLCFALLQLLFALSALYRPRPTVTLLLLCLPALLLLPLPFSTGLGVLALIWLCSLLPIRLSLPKISSHSPLLFWCQLWRQQMAQWLSRLMLILLCLLIAYISLKQRPDLAALISYSAGLLLLLVSASMQLNSNNTVQLYQLFFQLYPPVLKQWQFLPPLLLGLLSGTLLTLLGPPASLLLLLLPAFVVSWYLAWRQPQRFVGGWLAASLLSSGLYILLGIG